MGQFQLDHVSTNDAVADGFTKSLNHARHAQFVKQLGLCVAPRMDSWLVWGLGIPLWLVDEEHQHRVNHHNFPIWKSF